jgi:hypothetical protein
MVKKIRVVEEERTEEELSTEEFQAKMLEYMHTMDWKLWEILKIMQARFETDVEQPDVNEDEQEVAATPSPKVKKGPKSVIVDEDD